jgi:aryl-alcohol dehydrogenase-like predicted oxidoreductase
MVTFNLLEQKDREVIQHAHQSGKAIFIKKAFASGHLAQFNEKDPVAASMKFIFSEPGVTSVVLGTLNREHLHKNVNAALAVINEHK